MKKTILFICSLLTSFSFCQDFKLVKASDHIEAIANHKLENKPNIFITDFNDLDTLIKRSKKKYKIVYNFSSACFASVEAFPLLLKFLNENEHLFDLFNVSGVKYKWIPRISEYLKKINYFNPVYLVDTEKYGKYGNRFNRLGKVTKQICNECNTNKMGASSFFVVDENNKVVTHTNYYMTWDEKFSKLKQLIKTNL